jgi:hypothetical protein
LFEAYLPSVSFVASLYSATGDDNDSGNGEGEAVDETGNSEEGGHKDDDHKTV